MSQSLDGVVAAIAAGEVVVIPTDTVYGLACDPANAGAVERIYAIKERPARLELTLMAARRADLDEAVQLDETALRLADRFWPGPLSIVAPVGRRRLAIPRSGTTLSTRVPGHALLLELLARTGPLATTSANRHGDQPATDAESARVVLGDAVAIVLDGGPAGGLASTIIDCSRTPPEVLREGPIPMADLVASAPIQTTTRNDVG